MAELNYSDDQRRDLIGLLLAQTAACSCDHLAIYRKSDEQVELHVIDARMQISQDFSLQLAAPINLRPCDSHYECDGGSRSVSADVTVRNLMPLVSPVTGVITHLEDIVTSSDNPIKIYRSGFFKSDYLLEGKKFNQNSFVQTCLGKGVSHEQSKASALSEAIERYCGLYQEDVPLYKSTQSGLGRIVGDGSSVRSLNFQDLVPYSDRQYLCFNDQEHPGSSLQQAAKRYTNSEIYWLPSWSLTHEQAVYLPLAKCFANTPFEDDQFGRWNSNGCAAGNTLEEAILQALFELIERGRSGYLVVQPYTKTGI